MAAEGGRPTVLALMGPTASGKTALAVELVQRAPVEIISVDSGMVYRGMDIGTAKPDAATLALAPHHLIDVREPSDPYSAADFRSDALACIAAIQARGHQPLLVGGSMLYFKVLRDGLTELPPADAALRAELEAEAAAQGWPALHARLAQVDAATAARLQTSDSQRIQRALEVYQLTGEPLSAWHARTRSQGLPFRLRQFALWPQDRDALHARIAQRLAQMWAQGLVEEVQALLARAPASADLPAWRSVGYRQVLAHLQGAYDRVELEERALFATRQLAKRQLTWLRGFDDIAVRDPFRLHLDELVRWILQNRD